MHKKTKTFIIDLGVEKMFGEIGFFTGRPRTVTAKSRTFSELVFLNQIKFLSLIDKKYPAAIQKYNNLRVKLLTLPPKDLRPLYIKCYRCYGHGHIVTECPFFYEIEGNMQI